jgi:nicotinate-nucleotide adenylyltransferase
MNKSHIGILGGSFNPIHIGHLLLAQNALESFELDRILFMPCHIQPLKGAGQMVSGEHRVAMIESAIMDNIHFELLDIELRRGGTSYAIDSVQAIREMYPDAELFFIIGADSLPELHLWHRIYDLLEICHFATLARPGVDLANLDAGSLQLKEPWPQRLLELVSPGRMIEISSSDIRHRLAEGLSIHYLVPQAVEMYIAEHNLYRE